MTKNEDILCFIYEQLQQLETYLVTCNNNEDAFLRNDILKDASLMKLLIVGEYSNKLTKEFRDQYPLIDWDLIRAARNYYAHAYGMVTWVRVWQTLQEDMPIFKQQVEQIINDNKL